MNRRLFVVTSKNTAVAEQILTTHSLRDHFEYIAGTERDGRFTRKADAVRFILEWGNLDLDTTVIVGDREHDMLAGKSNRIFTLGVTYGYGSYSELVGAGADHIADSPRQLLQLLAK